MKALNIYKIGGNVIDNEEFLTNILSYISSDKSNKILIHGGGKIANELLKQLGIEPQMVDGRRITDKQTLRIVTMVYAGWINKNIVARLQSLKCNAIGLTGADANCIPASKRIITTIDYGFVGDVEPTEIHVLNIRNLLDNSLMPVFAPITHDNQGNLLNTNADTIASSLSIAFCKEYKVKLVYCLEKNGVLYDSENDNSVISELNENSYLEFKLKSVIHSGMIPKLDNAFSALKKGVSEIVICGPGAFDSNKNLPGTTLTL